MTPAVSHVTRTWGQLLAETAERLGDGTEARWLIEEVSGRSWPELCHPHGLVASVDEGARSRLESMVERRLAGEPIQYVLGRWQFRTLELIVDRRVLIPRPETEFVAEVALRELDGMRRGSRRQTVVDLGTGSGAIGLSVAAERPSTEVFATDSSPAALEVAAANLRGLAASGRVRLVEGDWWSALPHNLAGRIDLVVSNPPYISTGEVGSLDRSVREWEPREALVSGPTGLEAVETVLAGAAGGWLRPGGAAVIEIAPHQAGEATGLAELAGFASTEVLADLAGRQRVLVARGAP